MQAIIYNKTASGLPDTSEADTPPLAGVSFKHAAFWGPLDATLRVIGGVDDGFRYAETYLGNPVKIFSPDGILVWEGFIWSVAFGAGRRGRTRSLEGYSNFVRVNYQLTDFSTNPPTDLGLATPITASDTAEQAIYSIIEWNIDEGGIETTTATNMATYELTRRKVLKWVSEAGDVGNNTANEPYIEVKCYGWWKTLYYQGYSAATTGTADISTVLQAVLTAKAPFISTTYNQMATTSVNVERQFEKFEFPGEIIQRLLKRANGYTFQIDFDRIPVLKADQRSATAITYLEQLDGLIQDAGGQDVPYWLVRPDTILRQVDFLPSSASTSSAIEAIENVYLVTTEFSTPYNLAYETAVVGDDGEVGAW